MRARSKGWILAAVVGMVAAGDAGAVRTRYFRTEGFEALRKGTLEGVALSEDGRVSPAPQATRLGDPGLRSVWALTRTSQGKIVCATGDQGQVYTVNEKGEPTLLTSLFNYELFAIAADGTGGVWVAGAPSGTITQVAPDGTTKTVFDAPEGLVLALLPARDGGVYAAAGERGRLYHIGQDGQAKVVCESGDLHLRTLVWSEDGKKIWAGTDGRGLLEEIDPSSGVMRILYDAAQGEIVSILPDPRGGLYFAANPSMHGGEEEGAETPPESASPGSGPVVYRLDASGSVRPFWNSPERTLHALEFDADGSLLVAAGSAGSLYRIRADGQETILWRSEEEQVVCLLREGSALYAGTANPGRVYRIGPDTDPDGRYLSEVFHAQDQVRWGMARWSGDGDLARVRVATRSGFTSVPDDSWSEWSPELTQAEGSPIASPPGHYFQYRLSFSGAASALPSVRRVEIAHIAANRPPRFLSLSISADEPAFQGDSKRSGPVTQNLPGGVEVNYALPPGPTQAITPNDVPAQIRQVRAIVWDADDPDNDELRYDLEIRRMADTDFRLIDRDLSDPAYALETGLLPDGDYEIRVTASDASTNVPGEEATAARLTPPFRVDNVPPTVTDLKARRVDGPALVVSGVASDQASPLRRMQISIDGREFRALSAKDGILDSASEAFEARLPLETPEQGNWVVVRVVDAAGNAGSFRAWLEP